MKRILLPLTIMSALLVSCNKEQEQEHEIYVYPTELIVGAEGGQYEITVYSTDYWTASYGWATLSAYNGYDGDVITLTVAPYLSSEGKGRVIEHTFYCHDKSALLTVMQQPDDSPSIQFQDQNFLDAILGYEDERIDVNGDGQISENEALICANLDVSGADILSMNEIRYFTYLAELRCSINELTSLDVSNNTALEDLSCQFNQLTSLDVRNNTALRYLSCGYNQLTTLNLFHNTALEDLSCHLNQLTSLDLSNNTALTNLTCSNNQLTSLDLSNNTALINLSCTGNPLTKIILNKYHMIADHHIQSIIEEYGDIIEYVD